MPDFRLYSLTDPPLALENPQLIIAFPLSIKIRQFEKSFSLDEDSSHVCVRSVDRSIHWCAS